MNGGHRTRPTMAGALLIGTIVAAALAGCGGKEGPPPAGGKEPVAMAFDPTKVVGAVVLGVDGEIRIVDANGQPVPPCSLPGAGKDTGGAPECPNVRGTTILSAEALSVVRHTGSHCVLVGTVVAGRYVTVQLPPGCKH